ncbi:MAG: Uma2 family endonuclease [Anaerolineales bacterium]|nr:MAG: Uma2 family endonuclease [Anaerolineales bacterium]
MAKALAEVEEEVKEKEWPTAVLRPLICYPESDGEPMAETDVHINTLIYLREALRDHFRDDPQVYVAGNLFLYYEEGDIRQVVAPDVFVVKGVPKGDRRTYKLWEEGDKGPQVVFEVSSRSTRKEDLGPKKGTYEMLGVREYFLFDPLGEYLEPPLVGYWLEESGYRREAGERLVSEVLGLELRVEKEHLGLYDLETGEKLLSPLEAQAARREAEARAEQEATARRKAEEELARLRAEMARQRDSGETGP